MGEVATLQFEDGADIGQINELVDKIQELEDSAFIVEPEWSKGQVNIRARENEQLPTDQ